jgi:hypothetical protein
MCQQGVMSRHPRRRRRLAGTPGQSVATLPGCPARNRYWYRDTTWPDLEGGHCNDTGRGHRPRPSRRAWASGSAHQARSMCSMPRSTPPRPATTPPARPRGDEAPSWAASYANPAMPSPVTDRGRCRRRSRRGCRSRWGRNTVRAATAPTSGIRVTYATLPSMPSVVPASARPVATVEIVSAGATSIGSPAMSPPARWRP